MKLAIFISPKPFTNPHIALIQRNAFRSWRLLDPEIEIYLLGEEEGVAQASEEVGATHIVDVARNEKGTPLISSMFHKVRAYSDSPILAYVNADIILMRNFLESIELVSEQYEHFLLVGQRWDLTVESPIEYSDGWEEDLMQRVHDEGKLHRPSGSDYFVFPRQCFTEIPDFAIGRAGWDNWMIYEARRRGWPLINATESIHIVHQRHDYSHLPGNRPHYRTPEADENIRLAGGKRMIFTLLDTNYGLVNGKIRRMPLSWNKFWREAEIFPLIKLGSRPLANVAYALLHPVKTYQAWRTASKKRGKELEEE
jgi:hypothetical protein